jgi:nicotinamide mononucleotide transporter
MSFYGWYMWLKKDQQQEVVLHISFSNSKMWVYQILFFLFFYIALYFSLVFLKDNFFKGAIPWADAFASATAFTGMWLMTRKKVESWYWWIATNIASIPLYFVKGLVFTSVYYLILLVMAIFGLTAWMQKAKSKNA